MAQMFIFQQPFTMVIKWDRRLYETGINIICSSESKFFGQYILMAAGNICIADVLDTVHHERKVQFVVTMFINQCCFQ